MKEWRGERRGEEGGRRKEWKGGSEARRKEGGWMLCFCSTSHNEVVQPEL